MNKWSHGYITDTNYHCQFFNELSPVWMNFVLSAQGIDSPSLSNFTYCELGFGQGFTLNLLASANPQGDFWGTDFNSHQVLNAQKLAGLANLSNVHLFDLSFAEFLEVRTPQFDFIVLHGVLSWINSENRHLVIEFLRRKLKLGGVVYVSYNTMPGVTSNIPVRDLMKFYFDQLTGHTIAKIKESIEFVEQVKNLNAEYFQFNTLALLKWEEIKNSPPHYLAHEYFNRDWQSFYHYDVVEMLSAAKLTFVSSVDLTHNLQRRNLAPEQLDFLSTIANPALQETVIDYLFNHPFRRDIFIKGKVQQNLLEKKQNLEQLTLALTIEPQEMNLHLLLKNKQLSLSPHICEPLVNSLQIKPSKISDILLLNNFDEDQFTEFMTTLMALVSKGYIMPALSPNVDRNRNGDQPPLTRKFNDAVMNQVILGREFNALASPILGTGVTLARYEQLFLYAYQNDRCLVETTADILEKLNQRVTKNGQPIETHQEHKEELSRRKEKFLTSKLPILKQLQIA